MQLCPVCEAGPVNVLGALLICHAHVAFVATHMGLGDFAHIGAKCPACVDGATCIRAWYTHRGQVSGGLLGHVALAVMTCLLLCSS